MRILALVAALPLLAFSVSSQAQDDDDTRSVAAARDLFHQGVEAAQAEEWDTAVDRFDRSLRLRSSRVVEYNLGLALHNADRQVEAHEHLTRVIAGGEDDPLGVASRELVEGIASTLGRLRVDLDEPDDRLSVFIDEYEMPMDLVGVDQPAAAGATEVRLMLREELLDSQSVVVRAGRLSQVSFEVPELSEEQLGPMPEDPSIRRRRIRRAVIALSVLAGAAVIAGVAIGIRRSGQPDLSGDLPITMTLRAP